MRTLLGIDASEPSEAAVANAMLRRWPEGSAVRVLTVLHSRTPLLPDPGFTTAATRTVALERQREEAPRLLREVARRLEQATHVPVTTVVREGAPWECIVREARAWGADLIILGARRHGTLREKLLGSTTRRVAEHAPCAVEVARLDDRPERISDGHPSGSASRRGESS